MTSTMNPMLRLDEVARSFGGVPALSGLSLSAVPGTITGLIGPNGAGKSTVVNLVMGLLHLSSGRVLLDGQDVSTMEAPQLARAGVARTFQNIRLVPQATVLDNVLAGFHRHQTTGFWANLLGLRARARRRPRTAPRPWPCSNASVWPNLRSTGPATSPTGTSDASR